MGSLGRRAKISVMWSLIQNVGGRAITFLVFFVLARLLNAEDFGLVALALVVISFLDVFVTLGFGDAIVQRPVVKPIHLDSAFWISVIVGIAVSLALFFGRVFVADLLGNVRLSQVLGWLSVCPMINSLIVVHNAILRRQMSYRQLATRTTLANFLSGILGVGFALYGIGVWSLVIQQISYALVAVSTTWWLSRWRPRFSFSFMCAGELFRFGAYMTLSQLLDVVFNKINEVLIGIFLGAASLGYFSVGSRLIQVVQQVFLSSIIDVAKGVFARVQYDLIELRRMYLRFVGLTSLLCFPFFIGIAVVANDLVVVFFGSGWVSSGPVLAAGSILAAMQSVQYFAGAAAIATGSPHVAVIVNISKIVFSIFVFYFTHSYGVGSVAWGAAFAGMLTAPVTFYFLKRKVGIDLYRHFRDLFGLALITLAMVLAIKALNLYLLGLFSPVYRLVADVVFGAIFYLVSVRIFMRADFNDACNLILSKVKAS